MSSALLTRPRLPALASGEVVALVLVRSTVLDDVASDPPRLMNLDCVGVVDPAVAISETLPSSGVLVWSLTSGSAPVEDIDLLTALPKAAPPAAGEWMVSLVAPLAIAPVPLVLPVASTIAPVPLVPPVALVALASIPLLLVATGRSPEEFGRSCLVRTGEVVSLRRSLPLSRCPRFCSWPGSIIVLFVPFLLDMLLKC